MGAVAVAMAAVPASTAGAANAAAVAIAATFANKTITWQLPGSGTARPAIWSIALLARSCLSVDHQQTGIGGNNNGGNSNNNGRIILSNGITMIDGGTFTTKRANESKRQEP